MWSFIFFNELFITYFNILCLNFLRDIIKFGLESIFTRSVFHKKKKKTEKPRALVWPTRIKFLREWRDPIQTPCGVYKMKILKNSHLWPMQVSNLRPSRY